MYPHRECSSSSNSCQFTATFVASISDSKEDGCTVTAVVFTWSHSEPRSQAHLRLSQYCGTRVHGKGSHCAPLLSLDSSKLGRCLYGAGLFLFTKGLLLELEDLAGMIEMTIDTADIFGSDQIGIHIACIGQYVFHPPELTPPVKEKIDSVLDLESVELTIGGSNLVGALLSGNSNGMAVADIATESDIDILTSYGDVIVMEGGVNTAGNLLLVNEMGVVASPSIPEDGLEIISEVMKVDVLASTIAGQDVVGSLGVTNDQGILLHPDVTPDEVLLIEQVMKVPPMVGTACFGSPYVGAGICASNDGALAGTETTGPEMNRIEDALGFL